MEWRLFVSMILMADDYGNLRSCPAVLRAHAFWGTDASRESVARARETLARVSLVSLYDVHGQNYAHITGWSKHQRVDHPGKAYCPGQELGKSISCGKSSRDPRESLGNPRESLATDRDRDRDRDQERDTDCPETRNVTPESRLSRNVTPESRNVTPASQLVTDRHRPSQTVTPCRADPCRAVLDTDCPETETGGRALSPGRQALLVFPCDGTPDTWNLESTQVADWAKLFPSLDVMGECRKALAWISASPERRKTARGMGRFLVGWFGRSQNRGGGKTFDRTPPVRVVPIVER
jgi:hypothetical protein